MSTSPTIVVQKYGGSSVATAEKINQVAERIANTVAVGHRVCVVVSAMAHTTDELMARAKEISWAPPRRELDMLLSCGERAAMALLSMAVIERGLDAISFTGSQCGIMTNDRHWGAQIVEVRPFRVTDELERGRVVIVAGFQGVSYKREITTLGRGGSDTTAVALAAALGAEYCEICSDVDGVYSADPRIVDSATLFAAIGHDDMLELAAHGAKVLHPAAIEFARRLKIALWARGTSSDGRGTRIDSPFNLGNLGNLDKSPSENADGFATASVGISSQRNLVRICVADRVCGRRVVELLDQYEATIAALEVSEQGTEIVVETSQIPDWSVVQTALLASLGNAVVLAPAFAVSVVGGDIGANPSATARVLALAEKLGVTVTGVLASPLRITVRCATGATNDHDALVNAFHTEFVTELNNAESLSKKEPSGADSR